MTFSAQAPLCEIEKLIFTNSAKLYSESDFTQVETAAKKSQNNGSIRITEINREIALLLSMQQDLVKINDVAQMQKELEEKKRNKDTILEDAAKELSQISRRGLYLVVLSNIDPFLSKEKLTAQAKLALAPKAIEDIRGVVIHSFLEDVNDTYAKSLLRSTVSGQMTVENAYMAEKRNASKKFIYLSKVCVLPLKATEAMQASTDSANTKAAIVRLTDAKETIGILPGMLSPDDSAKVFQGLDETRATIAEENAASQKQEQMIVSNTLKHITDLNREITQLETELLSRDTHIKSSVQQITGTPCAGKMDDCLAAALDHLKKQFTALEMKKIAIKESETITQRTVLMPEGEPAKEIALAAKNVIGQLNSTYGKIEQFIDVAENMIEEANGVSREVDSKTTRRRADAQRTVDSVSLFINPQDDGSFKVLIAVNFRIDDQYIGENFKDLNESSSVALEANKSQPGKDIASKKLTTQESLEMEISQTEEYLQQHAKQKSKTSMKRTTRILCTAAALVGFGVAGYFHMDWQKNYDQYQAADDKTTANILHTKVAEDETKRLIGLIVGGIGIAGFGFTYAF